MREDESLSDADREMERLLSGLAPVAAGRVDAVSAAFEAGKRAGGRGVWRWRAAAGVMAVIGVGSHLVSLGTERLGGDRSREGGRGVVVVAPIRPVAPAPAVRELSGQSLIVMQEAVSERGLAGLPEPRLPVVGAVRVEDSL